MRAVFQEAGPEQEAFKRLLQAGIVCPGGCGAGNKDNVPSRPERRQSHYFPKQALDPVSYDRLAYFLAYREATAAGTEPVG